MIFTTTSQSCNGSPNQVWAIDVNDPGKKVMTFNPRSGGLWGREGAAIDSTGTAWAPTGDGVYDPENRTFGNGLIGVKVEGKQLQLQDWFEPPNWFWMRKRDLDMQVTPAIFNFGGKELLATGARLAGFICWTQEPPAVTITKRPWRKRNFSATKKSISLPLGFGVRCRVGKTRQVHVGS